MTVILWHDNMPVTADDILYTEPNTLSDQSPPWGYTLSCLPDDVLFLILTRYVSSADAISLAQTSRRLRALVAAAVRNVHLTQPYKAALVPFLFPNATKVTANREASGHLTDEDLRQICQLPRLCILHIPFCHQLTVAGLTTLARLPFLHSLDLRHTRNVDKYLGVLASLPNLDHLDISLCDLTDTGMHELTQLHRLKTLILEHNFKITDHGLTALRSLTRLETLDLTGCERLTGTAFEALSSLPLQTLRGTALSAVNGRGVRGIAKMATLRTVFLDLNPTLTDLHVACVAQGLVYLTSLTLFGCKELTDRAIGSLKTLKYLNTLNISSCPNIAGEALAQLAACTDLTSLFMRCCDSITDCCLDHLERCCALTLIDVTGCHKVTTSGITSLARVPSLKTIRTSIQYDLPEIRTLLTTRPKMNIQTVRIPPLSRI